MKFEKFWEMSITLGSQLIHYIDSTFSNPTTVELQSILQDDSNCEKDSLMELLLFPDETIQLQLEALLERLHFKAGDEKSVLLDLLKNTVAGDHPLSEGQGSSAPYRH